MRRSLVIAVLLLLLPMSLAQATFNQVGSEDPYSDAQTGLTYAIWKPTTTASLKLTEIKLLICPAKSEQWLAATYGSKNRYVQIMETDSKVHCSDPGKGKQLLSVKIGTATAKVFAFCDRANQTAWKKCATANIAKVGGYIMWTAPKTKLLRATSIEVVGMGLSYKELLATARGMKTLALP